MALSGGDGCCWGGWHNQKANPSPSRKNIAPWSAMAWSLLLDDCEEMEMIGDASWSAVPAYGKSLTMELGCVHGQMPSWTPSSNVSTTQCATQQPISWVIRPKRSLTMAPLRSLSTEHSWASHDLRAPTWPLQGKPKWKPKNEKIPD